MFKINEHKKHSQLPEEGYLNSVASQDWADFAKQAGKFHRVPSHWPAAEAASFPRIYRTTLSPGLTSGIQKPRKEAL